MPIASCSRISSATIARPPTAPTRARRISGSSGYEKPSTSAARTHDLLPVDHRPVVAVVTRQVRPRLPDLRFQFVFVDRDAEPGIGRQLAISVLDWRQR